MALLKPFSTIQHQEGRKRRQVGEVWGEGGGGSLPGENGPGTR